MQINFSWNAEGYESSPFWGRSLEECQAHTLGTRAPNFQFYNLEQPRYPAYSVVPSEFDAENQWAVEIPKMQTTGGNQGNCSMSWAYVAASKTKILLTAKILVQTHSVNF